MKDVLSKKTYQTVDMLKLFFALCIVCQHTVIPLIENGIYTFFDACVMRLSVPFFFVSSGFFLGLKFYQPEADAKKAGGVYCKRLLPKLIFFESVSIILYILRSIMEGISVLHLILYIGRSVIFYPGGALWYIQAVLIAVAMLLPFVLKGTEWFACLVGLPLYGLALICNRYFFIVQGTVVGEAVQTLNRLTASPRNGLLYGFLFVALGMVCAKYHSFWKEKPTMVRMCLVMAYALYIVEFLLIRGRPGTEDASLHVMSIFVCPLLLVAATQCKIRWNHDTRVLRNLSTSVYLLHSPIVEVLNILSIITTGQKVPGVQLNLFLWPILLAVILCIYKTKKEPFYRLII